MSGRQTMLPVYGIRYVLGWIARYPVSALLLPLGIMLLWQVVQWAWFSAVFRPDLTACELPGAGACWGVVAEKANVLLFGRYPADQSWRALVFVLVWTGLLFWIARGAVKGAVKGADRGEARPVARVIGHYFPWLFGVAALWLLAGGLPGMPGLLSLSGLPSVPSSLWGGLVLTLLLSMLGFGLALPLGVLLALGRQSKRAWLRRFCAVYIEACRALPLVAVLFVAVYVVPLYLPTGGGERLPRVVVTLALFASAYLAEVIRGGLQVVPAGQTMAAYALGLGYWQTQWLVVLPQALRACLPSLLNSFVTLFKECSLVSIVSLFELTGALSLALSGDVQWRQYYLEGYIFVALVYWVYCYGVAAVVRSSR